MPRSFLVRTGSCRRHRVTAGQASEVGIAVAPADAEPTVIDCLPVNFKICNGIEEHGDNASRLDISINGLYFALQHFSVSSKGNVVG